MVVVSIASAQVDNAPKVIADYVAAKGKKAKVPAEINKMVMGDLNGDGKDDAVVQYYVQIGYPGNMTSNYVVVFLGSGSTYKFASEMASQTMVPSGIVSKIVSFDLYNGTDKFTKSGTAKYKLVGKKLVKL
jgi:hypothetical protein